MENARRIINDNDPLETYERATQRTSNLAQSQYLRGMSAVPEPVSQTSVYKAKDSLYNSVASVVDAAFITKVSNECIFELDNQIDDARVRGQSPLALTIAEQKLARYGRATDIYTEHHIQRRLEQS